MRTRLGRACVGLVALSWLAAAAPAPAETCGDADGNDTITVTDGVRVLRAAAGLGDCELARCDVDGSGGVSLTDGVNVLRAAAGLVELTGCPTSGGGTRRGFLQTLTTDLVLPRYRALAAEAVDLEVAVDALVSTPGLATLAIAQDAWRATRAAWKKTEAFRLGPSESQHTAARIDWPAANPDQIDAEVAGSASLSAAYLDTLGAPKVGLQALEYLLFDPADGDPAVVNALTGPDNGRRRAYLAALAANLRERAAALRDAWEPAGGNFGADFVSSGIGGNAFPSLKAAFDEVVNRLIFTAEVVEEEKLAKPLGLGGGGPRPDIVDTPRSGEALAGITGNLQSVGDVYRAGIGALVAELAPEVDADVRQLLDAALAAVAAVPSPLADAVINHPDEVLAAHDAVQALRRALTLDVASVLGVTLSFGGNDGD